VEFEILLTQPHILDSLVGPMTQTGPTVQTGPMTRMGSTIQTGSTTQMGLTTWIGSMIQTGQTSPKTQTARR